MQDTMNLNPPARIAAIEADTSESGFDMASEPRTGSWLRTLAASKPGGAFLELGTGTGLSACWLLSGMTPDAHLVTVEIDAALQGIAKRNLEHDPRIEFVLADANDYLQDNQGRQFDLIFADSWPGKFDNLELALDMVAPGGFYLIDDLLPQDNWPDGHAPKVPKLIEALESKPELTLTKLNWSTGLMMAVKQPEQGR